MKNKIKNTVLSFCKKCSFKINILSIFLFFNKKLYKKLKKYVSNSFSTYFCFSNSIAKCIRIKRGNYRKIKKKNTSEKNQKISTL